MDKIPDAGAAGDARPLGDYPPAVDYLPAEPATGESRRDGPGSGTSADRRSSGRPKPMPWQPFPVDALPAAIRRFVLRVAESRGVEPAMIAVPVLAVLSASIGNARRLRLKRDFFVCAVLWPALVAESGGGKSPALDAALKPVRDLQMLAHREYQRALAEHGRAIAEWKAGGKEGDPPPAPLPMRHFYVGDATVEAIAVRLADNERGLLLALDELAAWFKSWNAYKRGGGDRESFLSFYDARPAKIDRKATDGGPRTLIVPHAFVAVTGGIQPAILRGVLADPELVQCGMLARLLLAMPPERQMLWRDAEADQAALDGYADVVAALATLHFDPAGGPVVVGLTQAAFVAHREWFDRMERARMAAPDADERAAIPKIREAAARVALVLHLAASVAGDERGIDATQVDERTMRAGIAIADWFANEGRRVRAMLAGGEGEDRLLRRVRAIIHADGGSVPGTVTVREWDKRRRIGTDAARAELRELVDAGLGTLAYESTGGRQAERFRPRPVDVAFDDGTDAGDAAA